MQKPIDSYVCVINKSSESILIRSYIFRDEHVSVEFWYTYFTRKVNLTKQENFLTSDVYRKCRKV